MGSRELDAAGITEPRLRRAYLRCRALNARHGRTYFLATRLLSPARRPAVHALYGFARWADELVDNPSTVDTEDSARALDELDECLAHALKEGESGHAVLSALIDTIERFGLEHGLFTDFMASMRMDLTVTEYATFADLGCYVRGSAEVIGLQMLPVLGTVGPREEAEPYAARLGVAFQITNFLRDVSEDLDRGRIYLPLAELGAFGVDRDRLRWCQARGGADRAVRAALAHLIALNYADYRAAEPGIELLAPESRPCIRTAFRLYSGILDELVAADYDVFAGRVAVPRMRRLAVAGAALITRGLQEVAR
ncbi:phytoene/squalene synthase family protein [Allokutzneria sp. A3M-2-11 16]|uniref:phytoene/squalene synthase family protein n=1 Tax=Allokutzneria sp. A3M-2-11 16 TaxID=2962043 RepID=UPI0020B7E74C|nr:phytoene/squalene synthase family protein [Allokutzneria sp. A3M-2-11 16]MCP3804780.1 phytoene/squalene synthase family protein [Allokutzneria sp. A3M-2-11 16]